MGTWLTSMSTLLVVFLTWLPIASDMRKVCFVLLVVLVSGVCGVTAFDVWGSERGQEEMGDDSSALARLGEMGKPDQMEIVLWWNTTMTSIYCQVMLIDILSSWFYLIFRIIFFYDYWHRCPCAFDCSAKCTHTYQWLGFAPLGVGPGSDSSSDDEHLGTTEPASIKCASSSLFLLVS